MSKDNYQLENIEDAACKKSNNAKRVAMAAGLAVAGGGAAFAANEAFNNDDSTSAKPGMTADELTGSLAGGVTEQDMPEPTPEPAPEPEAKQPEEVHVYHHTVEPKQTEPEVKMGDSTVIHDSEGNVIAQIDEGTVNGNKFALYDVDGDGVADGLAYDANGNNVFDEDEFVNIQRENIAMTNNPDAVHIVTDEAVAIDEHLGPGIDPVDDDIKDIRNDFTYEKTGERYGSDIAQNNPDYNNHANVSQYAGVEVTEEKLSIEGMGKSVPMQNEPTYIIEEEEYDDPYGLPNHDPYGSEDVEILAYDETDEVSTDLDYGGTEEVSNDLDYDDSAEETLDDMPVDDGSDLADDTSMYA